MSISRDDVAKKAGVGASTVSRVFNKPQTVAEETRLKVHEAAKALGYTPNKQASMLRRNDNGHILVIDNLKSDPTPNIWRYYSWLWASIDRALSLWFANISLDVHRVSISRKTEFKGLLEQENWAGVTLLNIHHNPLTEMAIESKLPYLTIATHTVHNKGNTIMPDEKAGAALLAQHLLETGHQRPMLVTHLLSELPQRQFRHDGFNEVFPFIDILETTREHRQKQYIHNELIKRIETHKPDCIFCHSSALGAHVLHNLANLGIQPGKDISLTTYDNAHWLSHMPLKLTTVDNHIETLIEQGMNLLLEDISHERQGNHELIMTEPEVIHGKSVMNTK